MTRHCVWITLGVVLAWAAAVPSAQAAKGVKKKGEHAHHGTVVAIHNNAKKGQHTFTIKVHHHHKKKALTAAPAATPTTAHHHHKHLTFQVAGATQFEARRGKDHVAASPASLHKRERVTVLAHGHMADKVTIHLKKKKA